MPPKNRRKSPATNPPPASPVGRTPIARRSTPPPTRRHDPLPAPPLPAPQGHRQAGGSSRQDARRGSSANGLIGFKSDLGTRGVELGVFTGVDPNKEWTPTEGDIGVLCEIKKGGSGIPACDREYLMGKLDLKIYDDLLRSQKAFNRNNKAKALELATTDFSIYQGWKSNYLCLHPNIDLNTLEKDFWLFHKNYVNIRKQGPKPFTPPPSPKRPAGIRRVEERLLRAQPHTTEGSQRPATPKAAATGGRSGSSSPVRKRSKQNPNCI